MATKTTAKTRACKPRAKTVQKHGTPGPNGRLTREETTNLILQATEAFHYQTVLGNIEPGTKFDDWRRDQVMDRVGKAGISKINRSDWKNVKALFLELSGREDEAFALLLKTGPKNDRPQEASNTWESSETYVALIREELERHIRLATATIDELVADAAQAWYRTNSTPFPGMNTSDLEARKRAIENFGKGPIRHGWLLAAARQRTRKPTLTMETLAERLDPETLWGLLSHLVSHINLREGRADHDRRKPCRYPKPADPGQIDDPF
jgi:hypothetical protein